ncbi:MAG: hypothetical protein PHQ19_07945, partial [Candidatus Krumholzibacteria bacterium]|nr:hypothetical protein [Candidatus Krumholzibacteria bacterium]
MRLFILVVLLFSAASAAEASEFAVDTVDLLAPLGLDVNAAGPVLVRMDVDRGRLVVANTLSSSLSVIDCASGAVKNIPLGGRAYQHLKSEAMTIDPGTGVVCLIGANRFFIVSPDRSESLSIPTGVQFESIAVDGSTGNIFLAGRESAGLGFYQPASGTLTTVDWLETSEPLINLNATPPPPIRRVISDGALGRMVAVDGSTATLRLFDPATGRGDGGRPLPLPAGGRWHLAGYREDIHALYLVAETAERKVVKAARIDVAGGG